jgi:hypothetical protein
MSNKTVDITEREEAWRRTVDYVRDNANILRKNYGNDMPLAICEGVVVDWGRDKPALTRRAGEEYLDQHVFVITVDEAVRMARAGLVTR